MKDTLSMPRVTQLTRWSMDSTCTHSGKNRKMVWFPFSSSTKLRNWLSSQSLHNSLCFFFDPFTFYLSAHLQILDLTSILIQCITFFLYHLHRCSWLTCSMSIHLSFHLHIHQCMKCFSQDTMCIKWSKFGM